MKAEIIAYLFSKSILKAPLNEKIEKLKRIIYGRKKRSFDGELNYHETHMEHLRAYELSRELRGKILIKPRRETRRRIKKQLRTVLVIFLFREEFKYQEE